MSFDQQAGGFAFKVYERLLNTILWSPSSISRHPLLSTALMSTLTLIFAIRITTFFSPT